MSGSGTRQACNHFGKRVRVAPDNSMIFELPHGVENCSFFDSVQSSHPLSTVPSGTMSRAGWRAHSQAPALNANLYCSRCVSQIGIFDNEWIRLTPTYAKARGRGTHIGVETGMKVKLVPLGQGQKTVEGCGMSEVFCMRCSALIGQYCRTAPNVEKEELV